jgi:hypothetical protein
MLPLRPQLVILRQREHVLASIADGVQRAAVFGRHRSRELGLEVRGRQGPKIGQWRQNASLAGPYRQPSELGA